MNPDGSPPNYGQNPNSGGNPYPGGPPYTGFPPYSGGPPYPGFPPYAGGPYVGSGRPFNPQAANAYYQFCYGRGFDPHYGDELYRPTMGGTPPGSNESNVVPETDPDFSTEEYELSDMQPSPPKENPTPPPRGRGKRRGKGKAAEPSEPAPVGKAKRVNYSPDESMALARCWVDVSEDPIVSNMQTQGGFWGRVTARYAVVKPDWAKAHNADQLRKHWERMKADIAKWQGIYENNLRMLGSGQSQDDVKELSMREFSQNGIFTPFKHWDAWLILKDIPKFQAGLDPNAPKRTRLNISGSYSSSGGGEPIDLTSPAEESEPTRSRPMGVKAAKRKGKAKASREEVQSGRASEESAIADAAGAELHRTLLDSLKMYSVSEDDELKNELRILIRKMKRKLGMSGESI